MAEGGRIISTGSDFAERVPRPGLSLYAASKAALVGLTKGMARDLGPRGITLAGCYGRANIGPQPSVAAQHEGFGDVAAVVFVSSTGRDHVIYALFFRTADGAHDHACWFSKKGPTLRGCRPTT